MTAFSQNITINVPLGGDLIACRFDYPQTADEPFLFSIPKTFTGNDWAVLQHVLNGREGRAQLVRVPVDEDLAGFKVYDISNYIPQFVRDRLGKDRDVPGPNCYQAALASLGFEVAGRHVDPLEAGYYFSLHFAPVDDVRNDSMLGDIRIYYKRHKAPASALGLAAAEKADPALEDIMEDAQEIPKAIGATSVHMFYLDVEPTPPVGGFGFAPEDAGQIQEVKAGVHAALVLMNDFDDEGEERVFQRGGWHVKHVNRIVSAALAMSSIEPISDDPFYPAKRADDDKFVSRVIRMLTPEELAQRQVAEVIDDDLSAKVRKYADLIKHYADRLEAVANLQWTKFADNRVDLLSMENLWTVLERVEVELRKQGYGMIRALQTIDEDVAKAYLKLRSLRWQYQVMVNRYDAPGRTDSPRKKAARLRRLYKEHYIHSESDAFREEVALHLDVLEYDESKRDAIIEAVIVRVKATDPSTLVRGRTTSQIDFFEILNEAIAEV